MQFAAITETFRVPSLYYYARRAFCLAEQGEGMVRIATEREAIVWLNGVYLGRTYLRHHDEEFRYEEFDLTAHLQPGENVLAVLLHAWGTPEIDIPGVEPPQPIHFAVAGRAGGVDFADLTAWRVAPATEYLPARRHNSLIGHEELRDLRQEPLGWREPGFDDSAWQAPCIRETDEKTFLPSPLRHLYEEVIYPARIVTQGVFREAIALHDTAPTPEHRYWRIRIELNAPCELVFYYKNRLGTRLWVDEEERSAPFEPPFAWVEPFQPVFLHLAAGKHEIVGQFPPPAEFQVPALSFGWRELPTGGDQIAWATERDGEYTPGQPQPDVDKRPMIDTILPEARCALGAEGELDLTVKDEEVALIFEFPRSITMLPQIEIADASDGTRLELIYSERLSEVDGLTLPAAYTDRVILRDGAQHYATSFQYKSARILMLIVRATGGCATIRRVSAVYRHYDYDQIGEFASNDTRLNACWEICRNTMEFGSQDIIMDGPWREQLLYIGDNYVHNQACYHLFGNHEIVEWQHTLYAQGQMPDGIFQPNQPCRTPENAYRLLDQTILWPIQLEHHLQYTGRRDFVENLLPNVVRLMDGFHQLYGQGDDLRLRNVTGWNWVDHPGLEDGVPRSIRHDGIPTAINVLYLLALQSSSRLLSQFGCDTEAARLQEMAVHLRTLLLTHHWNAERQLFADCVVEDAPSPEVSVHVNLLAIEAGLADDPHGMLDRSWKQSGVLQICGPFFRVHLFEVLHRLGRFEEMLAEIREMWGGFVDAGLTSTPENTPINAEWGESVGHPWGATPATYLVKSLAGLSPLDNGWRRVRLAPQLCDLQGLRVTVPTPYGPITMDLQQEDGEVTGSVTIPAEVELIIPDAQLREAIAIKQAVAAE